MITTRSSKPETRNPVLALPSAAKLRALPALQRSILASILSELSADARKRAQKCWDKHKAPMAAYWKSVAVYARHIAVASRAKAKPAPARYFPKGGDIVRAVDWDDGEELVYVGLNDENNHRTWSEKDGKEYWSSEVFFVREATPASLLKAATLR